MWRPILICWSHRNSIVSSGSEAQLAVCILSIADLMALNPSSPIHVPGPILYAESPLSKLPVELTLRIFRFCPLGIKARLDLTHVCRQWRSIAVNSPSMWTFIQIISNFSPRSKLSDNVVSLLNMQLDRTEGLPLDVEWASSMKLGYDPRLLDTIRRKGPFLRWRTLKLGLLNPDEALTLDSRDAFSNLESIIISSVPSDSILETINRTTTSKLQFLELRNYPTTQTEMERKYGGIIRRIRHLRIYDREIPSIPSNIRELDAGFRFRHHIPDVETYKLTVCILGFSRSDDLHGVTSLTVTTVINLHSNSIVSLPALRHLSCRAIVFEEDAKFEAPALETLHLLPLDGISTNGHHFDRMINTLIPTCYRISPTKSITLETYLPQNTMVTFLEQAPCVEQVSLSFGDRDSAEKMLKRMQGLTLVEGQGEVGGWLCEKMVELRINLGYSICDVHSWKEWASQFVERSRNRSGSMLRVYASWKGEGTYVMLA